MMVDEAQQRQREVVDKEFEAWIANDPALAGWGVYSRLARAGYDAGRRDESDSYSQKVSEFYDAGRVAGMDIARQECVAEIVAWLRSYRMQGLPPDPYKLADQIAARFTGASETRQEPRTAVSTASEYLDTGKPPSG